MTGLGEFIRKSRSAYEEIQTSKASSLKAASFGIFFAKRAIFVIKNDIRGKAQWHVERDGTPIAGHVRKKRSMSRYCYAYGIVLFNENARELSANLFEN